MSTTTTKPPGSNAVPAAIVPVQEAVEEVHVRLTDAAKGKLLYFVSLYPVSSSRPSGVPVHVFTCSLKFAESGDATHPESIVPLRQSHVQKLIPSFNENLERIFVVLRFVVNGVRNVSRIEARMQSGPAGGTATQVSLVVVHAPKLVYVPDHVVVAEGFGPGHDHVVFSLPISSRVRSCVIDPVNPAAQAMVRDSTGAARYTVVFVGAGAVQPTTQVAPAFGVALNVPEVQRNPADPVLGAVMSLAV